MNFARIVILCSTVIELLDLFFQRLVPLPIYSIMLIETWDPHFNQKEKGQLANSLSSQRQCTQDLIMSMERIVEVCRKFFGIFVLNRLLLFDFC